MNSEVIPYTGAEEFLSNCITLALGTYGKLDEWVSGAVDEARLSWRHGWIEPIGITYLASTTAGIDVLYFALFCLA